MAFYYHANHPLIQLLPRAVNVTRPSAIGGMVADLVYDYWADELGLAQDYGGGILSGSENVLTAYSQNFAFSTMVYLWPETDVSDRSNHSSLSGRFCMSFYHDTDPGNGNGNTNPALIDMSLLTGYSDIPFYGDAKLPAMAVFIGERDTPYYRLDNLSTMKYSSYGSLSMLNCVVYKFPLGLAHDDTEPVCTLVVRITAKDNSGETSGVEGYESVGVEFFIESLSTVSDSDIEFHIFTLNEGADSPENLPENAIDGDSFVLEGGKSHYIGLREELQTVTSISGNVKDGEDPVERDIFILYGDTMGVVGETRSAADGTFSYNVREDEEYCIVCRDEGENPRNSLIFDHVYGAST